ncbi:energy coupling factor transporter S component ThiW [Oceanobacillus massiliensis]|uniref:energy coupling factor transporter S component ThiW n=1 Tax=Oceanobacillus massiliensis TaxID=1465765 RepID=UPI000289C7FB|nr:energy coupling factor transporter S component ThiW [Oceanobacillus massiliensis]
MRTRTLTTMAVFIAIGTIGAQLLWFPTGIARAYPVQHAVNVMAGIMLGPGPAVVIAFMIGLLRNLFGPGTLLAFPGGMIGAFFAGYLYKKVGRKSWAIVGEAFGSGILGSLFAVPFAYIFMGTTVGVFAFLPGFIISSISGACIGWFVVSKVKTNSIARV